ncbi:MAG: hypothetical protein NC123_07600 [Butyrivibrio sp.]|nr:hypothetical protein [Acetatifactor muris]MCM1559395.1 hypothetical protein [Butyrivibrio sp.]
MGIGGIKAMDGMTGGQRTAVRPVDFASKNIQDEISSVQRQKQGISSKQEMSAEEKEKKRQELQQELSSLNTQLRQRQAETHREQKKEELLKETQSADSHVADAEKGKDTVNTENAEKSKANSEAGEERVINVDSPEKETVNRGLRSAEQETEKAAGVKNKDTEPEDVGMPVGEMRAIVEREASGERTKRKEAVIARLESGIVILKGEIRQDELRGADVEKKKAELKRQEQKVQRAASGLPNVKEPSSAAGVRGDAGEEKARAAEVRRSRDGVVIVTQGAMPGALADNYFR